MGICFSRDNNKNNKEVKAYIDRGGGKTELKKKTFKNIKYINITNNKQNSNKIPFIYEPFLLINKKDDNLELTNFFQDLCKEKVESCKLLENCNKIINKVLYNEKDIIKDDENNRLNIISQKIDSDFGFHKKIEDDFENTKIYINSCEN